VGSEATVLWLQAEVPLAAAKEGLGGPCGASFPACGLQLLRAVGMREPGADPLGLCHSDPVTHVAIGLRSGQCFVLAGIELLESDWKWYT
jgi:hypothetical protein